MKKTPLSLKVKLIATLLPVFLVFTLVIAFTSYILYYINIKNYTDNQIEQSSYQCINNYETFFSSVIETSNSIERKVTNIDIEDNPSFNTYLDDVLNLKNELSSASIYSLDGMCLASNSNYTIETNITNAPWFINAKNNKLIAFFSGLNYSDGRYGFTLSKYITYNHDLNEGILKLDLDFTNVINLISETDLGVGGHVSIYDNDYGLIYCSEAYNPIELEEVKKTVLGTDIVSISNTNYWMFVSTLTNTRWKVAIFTNYDGVSSTINNFLIIILVSTFIIIVLEGAFIYIFSTEVTYPIRILKNEMNNVESLNYDSKMFKVVKGNKEVIELSNSFNQMMKRIDELAKKNIEDEKEKRRYELRSLQNQINPHFLYNTLDSIVYLIEKKENDKAEEMIIALSKLFRISISRGKNFIPLEKEIEHAKQYLKIQKIRFGDSFTYEININTDISKYFVNKLILQPIIENAIIHGFKEKEGNGVIKVNVYQNNEFLVLEVVDNGFGILPKKIDEIYKSFNSKETSGVGLKNVYQRLKLYYGEKADLKINSQLDNGTSISLIIPLSEVSQNEEK